MALYQDITSQDLLITPVGINAVKIGFRQPMATKAELDAKTSTPGSTGPRGATGPQGPQGDTGPQGPPGTSFSMGEIMKRISLRA